MAMLEEEADSFSLRAVARRAGVSATAPYRHFADRDALESALAAEGFRELREALIADRDIPTTGPELAEFGVAYVDFALRRPALFRLMFGQPCDDAGDQRAVAAAELRDLVEVAVGRAYPDAPDPEALALAGWGLVHGLAFLHLDRKVDVESAEAVAERVRATFAAALAT